MPGSIPGRPTISVPSANSFLPYLRTFLYQFEIGSYVTLGLGNKVFFFAVLSPKVFDFPGCFLGLKNLTMVFAVCFFGQKWALCDFLERKSWWWVIFFEWNLDSPSQ